MSTKKYAIEVVEGPLSGQRFDLVTGGMTLGRSSTCDIMLDDPALSRHQCCFELRDNDLWVIDLASANQTLVNNKAIDEAQLAPGDTLTVGETQIRVVVLEDEFDTPATGKRTIDLGFSPDEEEGNQGRRSLLRSVLWGVVALLILIVGVVLMWSTGSGDTKGKLPVIADDDHQMLVYYEKVEAGVDNIFRYEMTLHPNGTLSVKIDDLSGDNRHVRKEKKLEPATIKSLQDEIRKSGFFTLDKSYSGFASVADSFNQLTLTIALGSSVHTCRIINRAEPDLFKVLREKLETFGKNELGIWAIQFSTEKLTELAQQALAIAEKKFNERDVKFGNLFEAGQSYREAMFYLETVNPKPEFYPQITAGAEAALTELETRYQEQRFRADRAINLSEWQNAARELKILREMIPDRNDERNKEAASKLMNVESKLR